MDSVFTDFAGLSDGSNRSSFSGQGKVVAQHLQHLFAAVITYSGFSPGSGFSGGQALESVCLKSFSPEGGGAS